MFSFVTNEDGAISIEAGFYFVIYALICALFIDFSVSFMTKSKSDRVSASAVSILRERTHFYSADKAVNRSEADLLSKIISNMLDNKQHSVSIAYAMKNQGVFLTERFDYNSVMGECAGLSSSDLTEELFNRLSPVITLSDQSSIQYPLYQVRICMPGNKSLFTRMISSGTSDSVLSDVISKNIAIYR